MAHAELIDISTRGVTTFLLYLGSSECTRIIRNIEATDRTHLSPLDLLRIRGPQRPAEGVHCSLMETSCRTAAGSPPPQRPNCGVSLRNLALRCTVLVVSQMVVLQVVEGRTLVCIWHTCAEVHPSLTSNVPPCDGPLPDTDLLPFALRNLPFFSACCLVWGVCSTVPFREMRQFPRSAMLV